MPTFFNYTFNFFFFKIREIHTCNYLIAVLFAPDNLPKVLNKKEANLEDIFSGKILNKKNIKKTIIYSKK